MVGDAANQFGANFDCVQGYLPMYSLKLTTLKMNGSIQARLTSFIVVTWHALSKIGQNSWKERSSKLQSVSVKFSREIKPNIKNVGLDIQSLGVGLSFKIGI